MIEASVAPVRTLPAQGRGRTARYLPWLEVAALVRVEVAAWDHREEAWLHWAAPVKGGRALTAMARRVWPGVRAAVPGEPALPDRGDAGLDDEAVRVATVALWRSWRPELCRHRALGAVSSIGEDRERFRRRCLRGLGEAVRTGELGPGAAPALVSVAGDVEARVLAAGEVRPVVLRGGLVWLPEGEEPRAASGDLMLGGGVRTAG